MSKLKVLCSEDSKEVVAMKLSEIPENGKFTIADRYTIGGGKHFKHGGCQLTLLPNQTYTVEQALPDFFVAKGVCHAEQRSKTFGNVDELRDVSFTIDNDVPVIPMLRVVRTAIALNN
jgi:hypothetical protein